MKINIYWVKLTLGGSKDEHFSCFHSSCQLGLNISNADRARAATWLNVGKHVPEITRLHSIDQGVMYKPPFNNTKASPPWIITSFVCQSCLLTGRHCKCTTGRDSMWSQIWSSIVCLCLRGPKGTSIDEVQQFVMIFQPPTSENHKSDFWGHFGLPYLH